MIDIPDFVYPRDEQGNPVCPRCRRQIKECACPAGEPSGKKSMAVKPVIRLEKSGRRGKIVTVIANLPREEAYLKETARRLKEKTGSGGTHYIAESGGVIEIQGDHRKNLSALF